MDRPWAVGRLQLVPPLSWRVCIVGARTYVAGASFLMHGPGPLQPTAGQAFQTRGRNPRYTDSDSRNQREGSALKQRYWDFGLRRLYGQGPTRPGAIHPRDSPGTGPSSRCTVDASASWTIWSRERWKAALEPITQGRLPLGARLRLAAVLNSRVTTNGSS
jgi:hypothetical protein